MSLLSFHRGLITAAIVFCAGYGAWELLQYGRSGTGASLVLGMVFFVLAGGLAFYLAHLGRFLGYEEGGSRGRR